MSLEIVWIYSLPKGEEDEEDKLKQFGFRKRIIGLNQIAQEKILELIEFS